MELKFSKKFDNTCAVRRSNRTFMELKFDIKNRKTRITVVLIVPLWN